MKQSISFVVLAAIAAAAAGTTVGAFAQGAGPKRLGFFVTSAGSGKGADLGGLAGADKICQTLAASAGAGNRTWRAYLSTTGAGGVNARDRIGNGPWYNAKGELIARNVEDLHTAANITKQTALTEYARHPHRLRLAWPRLPRFHRHDLQQLDQ